MPSVFWDWFNQTSSKVEHMIQKLKASKIGTQWNSG